MGRDLPVPCRDVSIDYPGAVIGLHSSCHVWNNKVPSRMHTYESLGRIDLFWFVQIIPDTIFRREKMLPSQKRRMHHPAALISVELKEPGECP